MTTRLQAELERMAEVDEREEALISKVTMLANALEWLRAEVDMGLVTKNTAMAVDAALRAVGREP